MSDKRAAIAAATRARLRSAALEVFAAKGFHGATTRDIANLAGVSTGSEFVHFRTKADALFMLAEEAHEAIQAEVIAALDASSPDVRARVAAFVRTAARWHADNHRLARVLAYEIKSLVPEHYEIIRASRERTTQLLQEEIERGAAAGEFAVLDVRYTTLAIMSQCLDLARWFRPSPQKTAIEIGELYAQVALRMLSGSIHSDDLTPQSGWSLTSSSANGERGEHV